MADCAPCPARNPASTATEFAQKVKCHCSKRPMLFGRRVLPVHLRDHMSIGSERVRIVEGGRRRILESNLACKGARPTARVSQLGFMPTEISARRWIQR
jgi:hypothetical protein